MKLGLGTVQFGLAYGVSNPGGKTPEKEAREILELASSGAVTLIDTAAGYGTSEETIGACLPATSDFRIVTKTPAFRSGLITQGDVARMQQTFAHSLLKLRQRRIYGLLAHNADDLLAPGGDALFEAMLELKQRGLVRKVGASVYTGTQVDALLDRFPIDLVQLPINVFDQRMLKGGQLDALRSRKVEIHARSAFLQGLLLMPPCHIPAYFSPIRANLDAYHAFIEKSGLTPLQAAMGFVLGLDELDHVILGVNSASQLRQILAESDKSLDPRNFSRFALDSAEMLDPSLWQIPRN